MGDTVAEVAHAVPVLVNSYAKFRAEVRGKPEGSDAGVEGDAEGNSRVQVLEHPALVGEHGDEIVDEGEDGARQFEISPDRLADALGNGPRAVLEVCGVVCGVLERAEPRGVERDNVLCRI